MQHLAKTFHSTSKHQEFLYKDQRH